MFSLILTRLSFDKISFAFIFLRCLCIQINFQVNFDLKRNGLNYYSQVVAAPIWLI